MKTFLADFFGSGRNLFITLVVCIFIVAGGFATYVKLTWHDSVNNPANEPYVVEVAFNLGIAPDEVTQAEFDARYR